MAAGKLCFLAAPHNSTLVPGPKGLNYSFGEKLGYFVARYTRGEPLWLFHCLSKAGLWFFFFPSFSHSLYLARQPSEWKVFLTSSLLFTLPTVSHLPSFPFNLSLSLFCKDVYLYLVWRSVGGLIWLDVLRGLSDESIWDKRHEKTPVHGAVQLLVQLSNKRCLRGRILRVLAENQSRRKVKQRLRNLSKRH